MNKTEAELVEIINTMTRSNTRVRKKRKMINERHTCRLISPLMVCFIFICLVLFSFFSCGSVTYDSLEITYSNPVDRITLSGTLTIPKGTGTYPAVLLIQGSGPHARDEEILGHKPFKVIAEYLSTHGFAVLRVDRRGCGKSGGKYIDLDMDNYVEDALYGITYLKTRPEINTDKIGVIGHSLGGLIGAIASSQTDDISFLISLVGPGIWGRDIIYSQNKLWAELSGATPEDCVEIQRLTYRMFDLIAMESVTDSDAREFEQIYIKLSEYLSDDMRNMFFPGPADKALYHFREPQFTKSIEIDPLKVWENVHCPVFVINGSKDFQVAADDNLDGIKNGLIKGGNKHYTIEKLKDHNHLFQRTDNGSPEEYGKIKESFSPVALELMLNWINSL